MEYSENIDPFSLVSEATCLSPCLRKNPLCVLMWTTPIKCSGPYTRYDSRRGSGGALGEDEGILWE